MVEDFFWHNTQSPQTDNGADGGAGVVTTAIGVLIGVGLAPFAAGAGIGAAYAIPEKMSVCKRMAKKRVTSPPLPRRKLSGHPNRRYSRRCLP